ncbi:MAG: hypothetical protein ACK55Z_06620, partial [bacterium]
MAAKTCCRSSRGISGLVRPLAVSQSTLTPSITTGCKSSTGDLMAERVSGHVSWFAAMGRKSRRPSKAATAAANEGGEEFDLPSRRA